VLSFSVAEAFDAAKGKEARDRGSVEVKVSGENEFLGRRSAARVEFSKGPGGLADALQRHVSISVPLGCPNASAAIDGPSEANRPR
jgi:hypothetical protein